MQYEELTEKIIGCAYRVHNKMGFGFVEGVYEKCMMIELRKAGLSAEFQKPIIKIIGKQKKQYPVNPVNPVKTKKGFWSNEN